MKPLGNSFTFRELETFLKWLVDTYQSIEEIKEFLTSSQEINGVAVPNYPDINARTINDYGKNL